jgi:threonine dehydrogenase-like Zn-dependent dehydrogenase
MEGKNTMKAIAVFPQARTVKLIDHLEPQITHPTQVKLRMLEVGICGTDREICRFAYGTPPEGAEYLVLGHEGLGEVVEVGSAVRTLQVGDLVVPTVRRPCPDAHCPACRAGWQDFCVTGHFTERGIKEQHGFLAEFVVDEEQYMHAVPEDLRDVAVLVEPLTIAEKAWFQVRQVQQRLPWIDLASPTLTEPNGSAEKALVLGAGPVGLLGTMSLMAMGIETSVYDRAPAPNPKSHLVEEMGATYVSPESRSAEFAALVGQIDFIYEAVGDSQLAFQAMQLLGANSVFVFTGVPDLNAPISIEADRFMRDLVLKNQVILGTVNAGKEAFRAAIQDLGRFIQRWPESVRALITGRYPLEAYQDVLQGTGGGIKRILALQS